VICGLFSSHDEHFTAIPVISIEIASNVKIDNVPTLKGSVVRNAVADDLVY
jgi:hypothetical protein